PRDDREGLPPRSRRARRPLPGRVAPRPRGLADPRLARLPALRLPRRSGGEDMKPALALLAVLIARPAAAADADLRQLFPSAADVGAGPRGALGRLPLPAAVLAACRPDLADLRVFDAQGREVAYLVDAGSPARVSREVSERRPATVLSARRDEV